MIDDFKPAKRTPAANRATLLQPKLATKASSDGLADEAGSVSLAAEAKPAKAPAISTPKVRFWQRWSRKRWIIVSAVVLVLAMGAAVAGWVLLHHHKKPVVKSTPVAQTPIKPPPPTTETSTLTGLQVPLGTNTLPVTGVMIENSPDARPQSGLLDAGVVFEAVAEGGITRFLALFQSKDIPTLIGPVRSARPYYLDYLGGFDAAVAHVGGSPDALQKIKNENIKDLDQFFNSGAYWRVNSRYAPHNVYTDMAHLYNLQVSKGFSSVYTALVRKPEKASASVTAKTIDLSISGPLYNVHYAYDPPTNSYIRSEGGLPHLDEPTKRQLDPKVVIAIVVPQSLDSDGIHTIYQDIGSGKAYIFQDGVETDATWTKSDRTKQITFTDANNQPVGLDAGQTWISLVGDTSRVSYNP